MQQLLLDDLPTSHRTAPLRTPNTPTRPVPRGSDAASNPAGSFASGPRAAPLRQEPFSLATTNGVRGVEAAGLAAIATYFVCGLAALLFG